MTAITTELDLDTRQIVTRLVDLQERIADLTGQAEALKAELRTSLSTGDYTIDNRPIIRIAPTRRFDPLKAIELVPAELRPLCEKTEYDPAKIREYLAPALVESCMRETGKPQVRVL